MGRPDRDRPRPEADWADAAWVAALFAVDPVGLGGVRLRAPAGPEREAWLALLRALLPVDAPLRRLPLGIADERLLGGLDLAASLRAGRVVAARGVLAEADGGVVLLAMAERIAPAVAARIVAALDSGEIPVQRDGMDAVLSARIGLVALDEGAGAEEVPPEALLDRMAFHIAPEGIWPAALAGLPGPAEIAEARLRLGQVGTAAPVIPALCRAAAEIGVAAVRPVMLALRAARAGAALAGRDAVAAEDVALAARLVLASHACSLPLPEPAEAASPPVPRDAREGAPTGPPQATPPAAAAQEAGADGAVSGEPGRAAAAETGEMLLFQAAQAALPPGLLQHLSARLAASGGARSAGRVGEARTGGRRGRPVGVRPGLPGRGRRIALAETLRAAAPWQRLRRDDAPPASPGRLLLSPEDLRIRRLRERAASLAVFVVDASGSAALHRLAEAKGAVELLLAECYARRDEVAVVAFRGAGAEILLPPTRALARARRSLAALPGGGGTPLAAGLGAGLTLAEAARRRGATPTLVLLTDGRANIPLSGSSPEPGASPRALAEAQATAAARRVRATGLAALLIDTSPRPGPAARALAEAMAARYLPLPVAAAGALAAAVRGARAFGLPGRSA